MRVGVAHVRGEFFVALDVRFPVVSSLQVDPSQRRCRLGIVRGIRGDLTQRLERPSRVPLLHRELALRDHHANFLGGARELGGGHLEPHVRLFFAFEFEERLHVQQKHGGAILHRHGNRALLPRRLFLLHRHRFLHAGKLQRRLEIGQTTLEIVVQHFTLRGDDGKRGRFANGEIVRHRVVQRRERRAMIPLGELNPRKHEMRVRAAVV